MASETRAEYILRMAKDGGGLLRDLTEIEQAVYDEFALYAQITSDPGVLPSDIQIRPSGFFTDPQDLQQYLEAGGLFSTEGGVNVPVSWVWLLETFDEVLQQVTYQVYIQDTSGA